MTVQFDRRAVEIRLAEVARNYYTNKEQFIADPTNADHMDWLNYMSIGATTRPDILETVAVMQLGFTPKSEKHGLDGLPSVTRPEYCEVKVTTTDSTRSHKTNGTITVNDPSSNIIDKYDSLNPVFAFPLAVDGYLISIFTTPWRTIRPVYIDGIERIHEKNKINKKGKAAARNFSLAPSKWLDDKNTKLEWVYPDKNVLTKCLSAVKMSNNYKNKVLDEYEKQNQLHSTTGGR